MKYKVYQVILNCVVISLLCLVLVGCEFFKVNEKVRSEQKFKYTVNVLHAEKHGEDAALKVIEDKFNIGFEFVPISVNDWQEKVKIWVASGNMPDIMWADIQNYNINDYLSWVKQDILKPLPEFGEKYPNLQKWSDKMKSDDYLMVDGKRYAWPSVRNDEKLKNLVLNGFYYRKDWAEKLGMAKEEYTWDEFLKLAKAFVEEDPGNLGKDKTIGVAGLGIAFPHFAGIMQYSPYWEQYYLKNGKYVWGMGEPETLEGIKMARKMYKDGILWKDQLIAKNEDGLTKFTAGEVGICFANWGVTSVENAREILKKAVPGLNPDNDIVQMRVKGPDGKLFAQGSLDYWGITVFNKKMSEEKFNKILDVWDWIGSDEGYELATYGVEGIDWNNKNGKKEIVKKSTVNENIILKSMVRSIGDYVFEDTTNSQSAKDAVNKTIERYSKDDVSIRKLDYNLYFFNAPNKEKYGAFYEEGRDKIKKIIVSTGDVEQEWNEWKKSVAPKVELVLNELNTQLLGN